MPDEPPIHAVIRSALTEIEAVYSKIVEEINSAPDTTDTFTAVTDLAVHMRKLGESSAELRAQVASRIYQARSLSLASLAEHIGVSKARADQLIRNAKKQKPAGEEGQR